MRGGVGLTFDNKVAILVLVHETSRLPFPAIQRCDRSHPDKDFTIIIYKRKHYRREINKFHRQCDSKINNMLVYATNVRAFMFSLLFPFIH